MSDLTKNTIVVENSAELVDAMATLAAGGGGTILMKNSGTGYQASLYDTGEGEPPITITSFDPDDPAVIERLMISGRENITIDNVVFDSTASETVRAPYMRDLEVSYSTEITVKNSTFQSSATSKLTSLESDDVGALMAMVRYTEGFTFEGNNASGYVNGLGVFESKDVAITKNDFSQMQGDGMQFGGVQDVLIEENYMHDFFGSLQSLNHDDMIQFWGTNAVLRTENVIIRGNILDASNGAGSQAIFGGNEMYKTDEDLFQNIVIENNLIHNGSFHGITMNDTNDLVIRNNTILWNQDAEILTSEENSGSYTPGIRTSNSQSVSVYGNITPFISLPDGVDTSNNVIVTYTDKVSENYIETHFVNALVGNNGDLRDLKLLPSSSWVGSFGSEYTQPTLTADGLISVMTIQAMKEDFNSFVFSAALSQDKTGYLDDSEAKFTWKFSDGTVMTGVTVDKIFASSGENGVELTVETVDGTTDTIIRDFVVKDKNLITLDFEGTIKDASDYDSQISVVPPSDDTKTAGVTGDGFVLDGTSSVQISRSNEQILGSEFFSLSIAIKLDTASEGGTFLSFHQSMYGGIGDDGSIQFTLVTVDGTFTLNSVEGLVSDTDWHKIDVTYDSRTEALKLYVDGDSAGDLSASGQMKSVTSWNLDLGSTWGNSVKGVIDDFNLRADVRTAAEIADDYRGVVAEPDVYTSEGENLVFVGDKADNTYIVEGVEGGSDFKVKVKGLGGADEIVIKDGRASVRGNAGNDSIKMGDADDVAFGGKHSDLVSGGDGADRLVGNQGHDKLYGQDGDDVLIGSKGFDVMTGGEGADVFRFNGRRNENKDTITDFDIENDTIQIFKGKGFSDLTIEETSIGTLVSLSSGTEITLMDVEASTIDIDSFEFI